MADHISQGHVRVEERAGGRRVWVAEYQLTGGGRTRKTLGPAWVRASSKKTARGAVVWRAAHGSKPDDTYLTPADAQAKLQALLDEQRRQPTARTRSARGKTFGDAIEADAIRACDDWYWRRRRPLLCDDDGGRGERSPRCSFARRAVAALPVGAGRAADTDVGGCRRCDR